MDYFILKLLLVIHDLDIYVQSKWYANIKHIGNNEKKKTIQLISVHCF